MRLTGRVDVQDDPLRLTLLGKGRARMQLAAAEFLPYDRQLYILAADTACDLHVLEYNPERAYRHAAPPPGSR